jgi:ribosomal protein S6--L-glutamate ligase/tetrahydromethanopterin:alpha-L-glutamate ligase
MKAVILGKQGGRHVVWLQEALARRGINAPCRPITRLVARPGGSPSLASVTGSAADLSLEEADILFVRALPGGSLEQVIFRLNALHRLEQEGRRIVNPPLAIEHCACKFFALGRLAARGLPVPPTVVTERFDQAMTAFEELGGDVVVKPLFGSEGRGILRVSDPDLAYRTFKAIEQSGGVLYLQRYIPHGREDYRLFVIGGEVAAAMRRIGSGWKTNVSQGARPEACAPDPELRDLALRAAAAFKADYLGVDILPHENGGLSVIEVNAIPAWSGLLLATGLNMADLIADYVLAGDQARA